MDRSYSLVAHKCTIGTSGAWRVLFTCGDIQRSSKTLRFRHHVEAAHDRISKMLNSISDRQFEMVLSGELPLNQPHFKNGLLINAHGEIIAVETRRSCATPIQGK